MPDVTSFSASLDGAVFVPGSPGYEAVRNQARLATVKNTYDPHRFFDFPQAI